MSNYVFPSLPGLSIEVSRYPVWESTVQTSVSGRSLGITNQTYPRYRYKLAFEFLRSGAKQELEALVALFNRMRGRADTFLYLDEDDNSVVSQQIGIGDGSTTSFQLLRSLGGFVEPIGEAKSISAVTVGGAAQYGDAASFPGATLDLDFTRITTLETGPSLDLDFGAQTYSAWAEDASLLPDALKILSLDYAYAGNGRIAFATPPAVGQAITWSGVYYQRCRFDSDEISADRFLWQLWKAKNIEFTTVKG